MTPKNSNFSQRAHFLKKYKVWFFPCHIGIFLSYVWFTHNSKKLKHKTYNTSTQKVREQCVLFKMYNVMKCLFRK